MTYCNVTIDVDEEQMHLHTFESEEQANQVAEYLGQCYPNAYIDCASVVVEPSLKDYDPKFYGEVMVKARIAA